MVTREQIQVEIDDYLSKHLRDPHALRAYLKRWLIEKKLSEDEIEKIMSDLQTYSNMP